MRLRKLFCSHLIYVSNFLLFDFSVCGFANPLSFKQITETEIDKVEAFVREKLKPKASQTQKDCFGEIFENDSKCFQFMAGERLYIMGLAEHVKKIVDDGGTNKGISYFQRHQSINSINDERSQNTCNELTLTNAHTNYFLDMLQFTASTNSNRQKNGFRFPSVVKRISTYLRMIMGPLAYETIQKNLEFSMPSLSSINRYIKSANCHIIEGVLRCEELVIYLKERDLPPVVILSEDATRIIGRPQYDSSTNQIVGFTLPLNKSNGMPIPYSFPARNFNEIHKHFTSDNNEANFLNIIMAQSTAESQPFCLIAYGSDNCYSALDVKNRWQYIVAELSKVGIKVLGISSDSDPRYNSAMRELSNLGCETDKNYEWFTSGIKTMPPFYFQDTVHIATKLRNLLLRTISNANKLPFGKYFIDWHHLQTLVETFPKDEHQLTASVLNPVDRQNFSSALRMCHPRVIELLRKHIQKSEGTAFFLQIVRDIIDVFMNRNLTPIQRVRNMWFSLFVIRIWRAFIVSKGKYTLKENFLTSNSYACIELNAHSLVLCLLHLKEIDQPNLFKPHLYESQPCEATFRKLRSFTSTYSTVANCTVKESEARISKIQLQNDIIHGTSTQFKYPRLGGANIPSNEKIELPTKDDMINVILQCKREAIETAKKLGLISHRSQNTYVCKVLPYTTNNHIQCSKRKFHNANGNFNNSNALDTENFGSKLKNFADTTDLSELDETGPYVNIPNESVLRIVKKTSVCWLLRKDCRRLSSDRLIRVQYSAKFKRSMKQKMNNNVSAVHSKKDILKLKLYTKKN